MLERGCEVNVRYDETQVNDIGKLTGQQHVGVTDKQRGDEQSMIAMSALRRVQRLKMLI